MIKKKILISAYAVRPNSGSETGVGWNYIKEISQTKQFEITVVTEIEFKKDIDHEIAKLGLDINFIYISVGNLGRRLCWNQGNWFFYFFYQRWQYRVYKHVKKIHKKIPFDVIHHLNMIGFREPGYLSKIKNTRFILGPVGGYGTANLKILALNYSKKVIIKEFIKSYLNNFQLNYSYRIKDSLRKATTVFAAYPEMKDAITKYCNPILLSENGANEKINLSNFNNIPHPNNGKNYILFIGKDVPRKNLDFIIKVFENTFFRKYDLLLLGKIDRIFSNNRIKSVGFIRHEEVQNYLINADLHWFPSLHDSNATSLIESLSFGTPTLAFDKWGASNRNCKVLFKIKETEKELYYKWFELSKEILEMKIPKQIRYQEAIKFREENSWEKLATVVINSYKNFN